MRVEDVDGELEGVLITADELHTRLAQMAHQVDADYADKDLLIVGVLKGAVMVVADFVRALSIPVEMDWMAVSSYGSSTKSSGVVRILKDLDVDITGKHVLIVEDIVDSGLTLNYLLKNLQVRSPASLHVCALLVKDGQQKLEPPLRYVGFRIPDEFVVGYGLDVAERWRNLPFLAEYAGE